MSDTISLSGLPRFRCSGLDNRVIKLYQNMSHLPLLLRRREKKLETKTSRMLAELFPPDVRRSVSERKIITSDCVIGYEASGKKVSPFIPGRFSNAKPHEAFISAKLFTLPQPFLSVNSITASEGKSPRSSIIKVKSTHKQAPRRKMRQFSLGGSRCV
jgi:hypothetical protein